MNAAGITSDTGHQQQHNTGVAGDSCSCAKGNQDALFREQGVNSREITSEYRSSERIHNCAKTNDGGFQGSKETVRSMNKVTIKDIFLCLLGRLSKEDKAIRDHNIKDATYERERFAGVLKDITDEFNGKESPDDARNNNN